MRKKERQIITLVLIVLFGAIAWWAYGHHNGGFVDITNVLSGNTTENTTYQLAISNLQAVVDQQTGHVVVSFQLANREHFNISSVEVLYALNVADPNNATYIALNATEQNGTYKAEIPSKFGDMVYYKVKVSYNAGKTLESDVKSITVKDTTAPTLNSVSINYNSTTGTFIIDFNATDNDQIAIYHIYYADLGTNNTIGNTTTFTEVNATNLPITISNITNGNYYAFYFVVEDLSGNTVALYNETSPYIIQANETATWPIIVTAPTSS
ncbi:hypothetical protein [Pyrococcus horikoshii]|uniref:Uncharacterized protein n=2 Tax=Pyrococcus horikoshii TaxID=53953 RepID=O58904_PYRHO|nr:hypothetical protein [Pyrococcus horikoshii]BAA30292.1 267aa long hypothetical protein [Pyrococcus horikoshii OT3]HII60205.1 hypothetical protein [Pyrococcus horikoshii]